MKYKNIGLIAMLRVVLVMSAGSAMAQSQTTFVEGVKQEFIAHSSASPSGWYNSVEEAFAAHQAWLANPANCGPGFVCTVDNLQPCAGNTYYNWGQPGDWCWHWAKTLYGRPYGEGITGSINGYSVCPTDPYFETIDNLVSGTGTVADPRYFENRCERRKVPVLPRQCGVGNPIYPSSGTKRQVEKDYDSRTLSFSRQYDSDLGRFHNEYELSLVTPDQRSGGGCIAGEIWVNGIKIPRCFAVANPSRSGDTAVFIGLDGTRDEQSWNGTTGSSKAPYFKNRLVRGDVNGAPGWLLARPDENRLLAFDAAGRLQYVQRSDGSRTTLSYAASRLSAVTDHWGRTLQVVHGPNGVASIIDPAGRTVTYTYANVNRVTGVTYADGSTRTYVWDEPDKSVTGGSGYANRLTGIIDESGRRFASFGYSYGKALSTEYAGGVNRYAIADARSGGTGSITLTDPLGSTYRTDYAVVNGLSLPTASSQPAGSGCVASTSRITYDANANPASVDDLDGRRTCRVHDLSRNLETTRVQGLPNTAACGTYTAANAALPAGGRKTSTRWHPDWALPTSIAEPGRITTNVYNGQPDPFNGNAVAICAPADAMLADGKPIAVLCKRVDQATTDADGSRDFGATLQSGVGQRQWTWTYNGHGQMLTARSPGGDTTTYAYYADTNADHTAGDLQLRTDAAGNVVTYVRYDRHGQPLRAVDSNGVTTDYTYDLRQRLTVVSVSGQTTAFEYWPTGLLRRVTQPDGQVVDYSYDDAHRLVAVSDSAGNRIEYTLDNAGNRLGEQAKDPAGVLARQLARTADALSRIQQSNGRN